MSQTEQRSVLSRIIAAHLGAGPGQAELEPALQTGLARAIRRAGMPFASLSPNVADVAVSSDASLADALEALPEHGLLAVIEDEDGRRGLVALDHPLVDALIEVQATGRVEETDQPPRKVTRIDEALCRDYVDLMLGSFAQETAAQIGRDWPDRMNYGSCIADRGQLNLLMVDRGYRLARTKVTMGGRKTGDLVVLLPSDQALARRRALAATEATPVDWSEQLLDVLGAAPMTLDAVLMRVTLPLGKIEAMEEGELIPFEHSDLSAVTLEDETGHVFARGGLGQLSGRRAVRLGGVEAPKAGAPAPAMAAPAMTGQDMMEGLGQVAPALAPAEPAPAMAELPAMGGAMGELPALDAMGAGGAETGFDPDAPMGGFDPNAPMGEFDPNAPMGGFDPDAPMGDFDPDAPMAGFDPDAPMGEFDPNAPMG